MGFRHDTPSEDNVVIPITPGNLQWGLRFSRTHVELEGTWSGHSIDWEEWLSTAANKFLDKRPAISSIESERPSSAARGGQERVGEDSSQHIPGGIHLPPGGRANEYPGKGEKEDMSSFPSMASGGFNAVKAVLESHPDDVVERSLEELSQTYETIEQGELEGRLKNLSEALAEKKEEIKKAYSWTRTALWVSVAILFGIVLVQVLTKAAVPLYVSVLASLAGVISSLFVIVAARLFYRIRREGHRRRFLEEVVGKTLDTLKDKRELQARSTY